MFSSEQIMIDLKDSKKIFEEKWLQLVPWLIGLDALIIGANLSFILELQKQCLVIRLMAGFSVMIIWVSFIAGLLFKKKEVDFHDNKVNVRVNQYLKELDDARQESRGDASDLLAESSKNLADAVKKYGKSVSSLKRYSDVCVHSALVGLISISITSILLLFPCAYFSTIEMWLSELWPFIF